MYFCTIHIEKVVKLARSFNFTFRYIDEIKDTTYTDGLLHTLTYTSKLIVRGKRQKRWFQFSHVNFPFICSDIPAAAAFGVNISQLIRYSRACGSYQDFLDIGLLLTRVLLNQGFLLVKLKSSLRKFYVRHHDLVDRYGISVPQMTTDMSHMS
jgi:hypothetical protein